MKIVLLYDWRDFIWEIIMNTTDIVIETPKGSNQKYHFDFQEKTIRLKKILPVGMMFPYDFGFLPGTKGEDGDPLDVILLSEFPSFPGCIIECRLIGGFKAKQSKEAAGNAMIRNDRFFAVPVLSIVYDHVKTMNDLPKKVIDETEQFFIQYNKIEMKKFRIIKQVNIKQAQKIIDANRV